MEAAYREILQRHGYPLPTLPASPGAAQAPTPSAGPLEKSAASTNIWMTGRETSFSWESRTAMRTFTVPANGSFDSSTNATAPADPVLVAFYRSSGTSASTAYQTRIVGYNDDRGDGTQNARVRWTNTTGVNREVSVVIFAKSVSARGITKVTFRLPNGVTETSQNAAMYTWPIYDFFINPRGIGGCHGPHRHPDRFVAFPRRYIGCLCPGGQPDFHARGIHQGNSGRHPPDHTTV